MRLRCTAMLAALLSCTSVQAAEMGTVVKRFRACDYFVADGPNGLYVLEWYGGYDPDEGDRVYGEISSYGMKDVVYPDVDSKGRLWVEDYRESERAAMDEISDHC